MLYGNLSVLGLLIMKNKGPPAPSKSDSSSDFSIFKFLQCVVRFLWDAHNCEDSPADSSMQLGVSFAYVERWNDLEQLWFLGMQILNSLMKPVNRLCNTCRRVVSQP